MSKKMRNFAPENIRTSMFLSKLFCRHIPVSDPQPEPAMPQRIIFHFPESLTTHIDGRQVLFLPANRDTAADRVIEQHYDDIVRRFADAGLQFVHLGHRHPDLAPVVAYHRPDLAPQQWQPFSDLSAQQICAAIRSTCLDTMPDEPLLLRYKHRLTMDDWGTALIQQRPPRCLFSAASLLDGDDNELINRIMTYPDNVGEEESVTRYSLVKPQGPEDFADFEFNVNHLCDEIRQRVEQLRHLGISEAFLLTLLAPQQEPGTLVITPDFKLLLPDYGNIEIHLTPITKALYFLFLRHPEGILLKHLRDHRVELSDLYMLLSNREDLDKMNHSLDLLVDSTQNSINEKCSRIKEAFLLQFDDALARQYYLTGYASNPKGIRLPRHLVQDRSGLILPHTDD